MKSFKQYYNESLKPEVSIEDLMLKHKVSKDKIEKALKDGTDIEMEHTTDRDTARRIASQHIEEMLDYYDRLAKIEK